jgi:3-hydroxyisobutyrate dehydrogenase-like beta-hydroxyacid dehydrogenase
VAVGFVGVGSQGGGIVDRLHDAGLPVTVWARRAESLRPFAARVRVAPDPVALGAATEVVGICVTDGPAVRAVVDPPHGVLAGMRPGSVLVLHSTIGPGECASIAAAAAEHGVHVVDAPVSGGGDAARAGALTVYVGGDPGPVERVRPVLEVLGPVLVMGPPGSGLVTKLVNNALVAAHFALAHDALAAGVARGLDAARLGEALRLGSGRSFSLEVLTALGTLDGIAGTVGPLLAKDVGLFADASGAIDGDALLAAADRFLGIVGCPRATGAPA